MIDLLQLLRDLRPHVYIPDDLDRTDDLRDRIDVALSDEPQPATQDTQEISELRDDINSQPAPPVAAREPETEQSPATHGRQRLGEIPAVAFTASERREAGEAAGDCSAQLPQAIDVPYYQMPQHIIDKAVEVRRWFEARGLKQWTLAGIGPAKAGEPVFGIAPIANLIVRDGLVTRAGLYAPGLPDGLHDVFPVPVSPDGEWRPFLEPAQPLVVNPLGKAGFIFSGKSRDSGAYILKFSFETQEDLDAATDYYESLGEFVPAALRRSGDGL